MIDQLNFRLKHPLETAGRVQNQLRMQAYDEDGSSVIHESYEYISSHERLLPALADAESILNGEDTVLVPCHPADRYVVLESTKAGLVLDVRDAHEATTSYLDAPVPIAPETALSGLVDFASEYLSQCREAGVGSLCANTSLEVSIADARRRLEYQREVGTQEGYESSISREHLETFATNCVMNDRLREFVLEANELKPFVRELTEDDNDTLVRECYGPLLGRNLELAVPTATVLTSHPDRRAKRALIGALYSFPEDAAPFIEALGQIPDAEVVDNIGEILRGTCGDAPEVSRVAAEILHSVDGANYLEDTKRQRLIENLEYTLERAEDEEVIQLVRTVTDDLE